MFCLFYQTAFVVDEVSTIIKEVTLHESCITCLLTFHSWLSQFIHAPSLNILMLSLQSVEAAIGGNTYQHSRVNQWTTNVVEQCLSQLSKLGKPFKYIGMFSVFWLCSLTVSNPQFCIYFMYQLQPMKPWVISTELSLLIDYTPIPLQWHASLCRRMEQDCRQPARVSGTTALMVRQRWSHTHTFYPMIVWLWSDFRTYWPTT